MWGKSKVQGSRFRVNPISRRLLCEKVSDLFKSFVGSGFIPDLFIGIWESNRNSMAEKDSNITEQKTQFRNKAKELLQGCDLSLCLTCNACMEACPASGLEGMDPKNFIGMVAGGIEDEVIMTPWVWMCSMCEGCISVCPAKADIAGVVGLAREAWPKDKKPRGITGSCDMALKSSTSSAMGISGEDFSSCVEEMLFEVREEQEGWEHLQAPINKKNAYFFLNQNSREPAMEPDEMVPMWKILHLAGADWTYSTEGWAAENYCMFARDLKGWEHIVRAKAKAVENLGCKVWLNTECAHEMYAFRTGLKRFNIPHNFEVKSIVQYYAQWIREGKLKVNSEWNRALSIKFTFHDPCQLVRKSFGDPVAEDLRYVVRTVVGEKNFIDMTPSRSLNYCCGGGGGYLQSGFTEARYKFGAKKFNQIKATGADYCITACHNCHTQIRDLNEHYKGGYHTIHLWTIICLALGCLGENERRYLGPDLAEEGL